MSETLTWLVRVFLWIVSGAIVGYSLSALAETAPVQYRRILVSEARNALGMDAPVAMFAAQVHTESHWRPDVSSPYADGLSQFTPATATWAATRWGDLRPANVWDPAWSLRALVRYDLFLFERVALSPACDKWAGALSGYNSGLGWTRRSIALAAADGIENRWWGHVERYSAQADWAYRESRRYPVHILIERQGLYAHWGGPLICPDLLGGGWVLARQVSE